MTAISALISAFLQQRLPDEQGASPNTVDAYATGFQLLFEFASARLKTQPSQLCLEQIDAPLVLAFLLHLETERGNSRSTRNARLTAIKSFMRFVQYREPSALEQIQQILAIPQKKTDSRLVNHLSIDEMQAVLDAPDPSTRSGTRDRAMLHVAYCAGLRVSELVGLRLDDVSRGPEMTIHVIGKGRKERVLPLWKETSVALRAWLAIRGETTVPELFLNARRQQMTRWGFGYVLRKHASTAAKGCPSLTSKTVSPHVLRHTCAMTILQATNDLRKVALWLGHAHMQTSEIYTRADPQLKLEAVDKVTPPSLRRGRFRPPDKLLALLKARPLCGATIPDLSGNTTSKGALTT